MYYIMSTLESITCNGVVVDIVEDSQLIALLESSIGLQNTLKFENFQDFLTIEDYQFI